MVIIVVVVFMIILCPHQMSATCPPSLTYVPPQFQGRLIMWAHNSPATGNPGTHRTYDLIRAKDWWLNMCCNINKHVVSCSSCARAKVPRTLPAGKLMSLPTPQTFMVPHCSRLCHWCTRIPRQHCHPSHHEPVFMLPASYSPSGTSHCIQGGWTSLQPCVQVLWYPRGCDQWQRFSAHLGSGSASWRNWG